MNIWESLRHETECTLLHGMLEPIEDDGLREWEVDDSDSDIRVSQNIWTWITRCTRWTSESNQNITKSGGNGP